MRRAVLLPVATVLVIGLVSCLEPVQRRDYGDGYGPYDRADRYDIGKRIDNQQRRIDYGMSSGELTQRETDLLMDNLNWIRDEYYRAKSDGRLTQSEIERLSENLNKNNRMITDKKNNEIRRVYTLPAPASDPGQEQLRKDLRDQIENQQGKIDKGIAKGDLTQREADMLQDNLNYIRDKYSGMKADGRLTPEESYRLKRDLDINSRMIQDKRNNEIRRIYPDTSAGFQTRIQRQQKRIDDGLRSGELRRKEAEIVQANLDKIRSSYSRMKADGNLTEKEQDTLDKRLDRNDKMILERKQNAIERFD